MKYLCLVVLLLVSCSSAEYAEEYDWSKIKYESYRHTGLKPVVKHKRRKAKSKIRSACKPKSFRIIREEVKRDTPEGKKRMRLYYLCE